jgi:hypothetical protein
MEQRASNCFATYHIEMPFFGCVGPPCSERGAMHTEPLALLCIGKAQLWGLHSATKTLSSNLGLQDAVLQSTPSDSLQTPPKIVFAQLRAVQVDIVRIWLILCVLNTRTPHLQGYHFPQRYRDKPSACAVLQQGLKFAPKCSKCPGHATS